MRSIKLLALAVFSLVALVGCNQGQPRIYRVAIDGTPVSTIAVSSCFRNNNLPSDRGNTDEQFFRAEAEWVIWSGVVVNGAQVEYLDMGDTSLGAPGSGVRAGQFKLGDAPVITVGALIEGTDKTFTASRHEQKPIGSRYTEIRQTQISVKFDDYSFSPTGTVALGAQFACTDRDIPCPGKGSTPSSDAPPDAASCSSSIKFVARRIEAQQITPYSNNP